MAELGTASLNALAAKESMFKAKANQLNKVANRKCSKPWWPVYIIHRENFTFHNSACIGSTLNERAFEYGSSWVEHYYAELIRNCKMYNRMDIIKMLYRWYVAQFALDYLNEVKPFTSHQFLAASNLEPITYLDDHPSADVCRACRELMNSHDKTLSELVPVDSTIRSALHGFYNSVCAQCDPEVNMVLERAEFQAYMEYRTVNAGGLMGFVRQVLLFSYLYPLVPVGEIDEISKQVGLHVALVNDLYGVKKDQISGEPNMILKHQAYHNCTLHESVEWASRVIDEIIYKVSLYYIEYPQTITTKFNVAMACISGNVGFHETSTRYELPEGFVWPEKIMC